LLNPFVATISTRGNSEGLLGVMVLALLWAALRRRAALAGLFLGLGVHFKIYPFIYAPSLFLYMGSSTSAHVWTLPRLQDIPSHLRALINRDQQILTSTSLSTFMLLNAAMYATYGQPFLQHTYLHHLTRIDHRHNFSPYNILLYLSSASSAGGANVSALKFESLAFFPQLFLSTLLIPLILTKRDLAGAMLAQTWAFVALNKVCTSQVSIPSSAFHCIQSGEGLSRKNL
jgi:GPI mannosyltransferase 1 subunit M